MNIVPEMYFSTWGLTNSPRYRPNRTPKAPARANAKITAINIVIVDLEDEAAAMAANCVLSPISAKNIVKKVLANIFHSIRHPFDYNIEVASQAVTLFILYPAVLFIFYRWQLRKASLKSKFIDAMDMLQLEAKSGDLDLGRIFITLGEESHPILLLFLSLPYMIPVSIPGLSTPSGIIISIVAIMLYFNKPPWIPKRYQCKKISASTVTKVTIGAEKVWFRMSHLIKERWMLLFQIKFFRIINLLVFLLNAFLLSLPLPIPFSNTMPGIAIILCSLGYLEKDGFFIFLSYMWTLLVITFFASITAGLKQFL